MTHHSSWLSIIFMSACFTLPGRIVFGQEQELDENALVISEELLMDQALNGELEAEKPAPAEKLMEKMMQPETPAAEDKEVAEETLPDDETRAEKVPAEAPAAVEEPAAEREEPVEEAAVDTVDALVEDALREEKPEEEPAIGQPDEEAVEEVPIEELVSDEMTREEAKEELPDEGGAAEELPAVEGEPGGAAKEELFAEEIGEEPAKVEEDMREELAEEAQAVPVEDGVKESVAPVARREEPTKTVDEEKIESDSVEDLAKEALGVETPEEAPGSEEKMAEEKPPAGEETAPREGVADPDGLMEDAFNDAFGEALAERIGEEPEVERREEPKKEEQRLAKEVKEPEQELVSPDVAVESAIQEAISEGVTTPPKMPEPPPLAEAEKKEPDARAAVIAEMLAQEELRRRALEAHAMDAFDEADEAFDLKDYQKAIGLFQEALKNLGKRPETAKARARATKGLAQSHYERALLLKERREFDAAVEMAKAAEAYAHPKAAELLALIEREKGEPPKPEPVAQPPPRWKEPEFAKKEEDIFFQLRRGREHLAAGEYNEAQRVFEGVLASDPQNTEAIRLMRKTAQKKYDAATKELEATRSRMMADLRKTWNPRDYAPVVAPAAGKTDDGRKKGEGESQRLEILRKMDEIKIPEIDFRQANIHDVVNFLQEASVEFDASPGEAEKKGVNIILNLQAGRAQEPPSRAPSDDPFADPAEAAPGDQGAGGVPLITFSARYISLLEALKIVTEVANLKYRVEGTVVMIVPSNAPEGDIIVRTYKVLPSVEEKIPSVGAELAAARGGGGERGGDFLGMEATGPALAGADWKQFFEQMGVKWPEGSSIKYVRSIGKIVVANTEHNLTIFEKILSELNVVPNQIEIEARFVEINQTDLESMGFEWLLTDDWEILQKKEGAASTPLASRQRIKMDKNSASVPGGFTKGNRFLRDLPGGVGVPDDILSIAGVLTNPELKFMLHMLERKGHADLLSAPKVTTQAGQEATIRVVTEYIYPTEFEVTPITGIDRAGNATIVGGVVQPSGFETREVGVLLQVAPDVSPEGQMITLNMRPEVVSEPEWKNYGSEYTAPDGSRMQLSMEQPFFHTRTISTSISIYNEATVVMGGMITEGRNEVNDKIPFLGDIPVIGRLFRSKYEQSMKKNLLIFVTARLVDPAGRPVQMASEGLSGRIAEHITGTGAADVATE